MVADPLPLSACLYDARSPTARLICYDRDLRMLDDRIPVRSSDVAAMTAWRRQRDEQCLRKIGEPRDGAGDEALERCRINATLARMEIHQPG